MTRSTSLSSNVLPMLTISVVADFLTEMSFYLSRSVSSPRRSRPTDASTMLKSVTDVSECDYRHDSPVTTGQLQGVQDHNASYPDYCRTLTIRGEFFVNFLTDFHLFLVSSSSSSPSSFFFHLCFYRRIFYHRQLF